MKRLLIQLVQSKYVQAISGIASLGIFTTAVVALARKISGSMSLITLDELAVIFLSCVIVFFAPIAFSDLMKTSSHSVKAVVAIIEIITRRDLDNSGGIGDVNVTKQTDQKQEVPRVEEIRLVPFRQPTVAMINGVHPKDVKEFVERMEVLGWGRDAWRDKKFEGTGNICTRDVYERILAILTSKVNAIVDRQQGKGGRLVMSAAQILADLGIVEYA